MSYIHFNDLEVFQLAEALSDLLWNVYDDWEFKARQTIGIQMIRAADSIAVNIAEGYGRYTPNDRKRFYIIARGSL